MSKYPLPLIPPLAKVKDAHAYLEWHMQNGMAEAYLKGRMMAFVIPPIGPDSHDAERGEVFLNLIPE